MFRASRAEGSARASRIGQGGPCGSGGAGGSCGSAKQVGGGAASVGRGGRAGRPEKKVHWRRIGPLGLLAARPGGTGRALEAYGQRAAARAGPYGSSTQPFGADGAVRACRAGRATTAVGPVAIFGIPPGSHRPRGHCCDAPPSHRPTQHRPLDLARSASTSPPYPPGQRSGGRHRPERGPSRSIPVRPIPAMLEGTLPDEVYIAERKRNDLNQRPVAGSAFPAEVVENFEVV